MKCSTKSSCDSTFKNKANISPAECLKLTPPSTFGTVHYQFWGNQDENLNLAQSGQKALYLVAKANSSRRLRVKLSKCFTNNLCAKELQKKANHRVV